MIDGTSCKAPMSASRSDGGLVKVKGNFGGCARLEIGANFDLS